MGMREAASEIAEEHRRIAGGDVLCYSELS